MSNQVSFAFDVEGRRTAIAYPFGDPPVTTAVVYDIIGRMLSQTTTQGETTMLSLSYGYDQTSNRVGMVAGSDTFDYDLDAANRMTKVNLNTFVDELAEHFALGTCSGAELDAATPGVRLLANNDSFSGTEMDLDRWRLAYSNYTVPGSIDFVGVEMRQNDGLLLAYPQGYTDVGAAAASQNWADPYGLSPFNLTVGAELRTVVSGNLDIQVDFSDYQAYSFPADGGIVQIGMLIRDTPLEQTAANQLWICRETDNEGNQSYFGAVTTGGESPASSTASTTDTSGSLRLQRDGDTGAVMLSYWNGESWTVLYTQGSWVDTDTPLYVQLAFVTQQGMGSIRFANFTVTDPNQYPASGTFTSSVYDCGSSTPTWGALSWEATTPTGTAVGFQLASSDSPAGPWSFVGPTGSSSFYTISGTSIPLTGEGAVTGRYLRYQATLTGPNTATPELTQVAITYSGTNASTQFAYQYDVVGNITSTSTQTSAGTATEARTFNDLNQLTTNVVTPVSGGSTTYTHSYNPDGTLASKTDGTNTWTYSWDPGGDQRLLSFSYNGVTQVSFTYDSLGRMMTRTPYTGGVAGTATKFEWDGWTWVRELTPTGTFRYYAPQGELLTFDYTPTGGSTSTYCVHSDALGSVRAITDSTGAVVAHYEYDAWGNQLSSSSDLTPSFPYRYVGSLGVRWDASLGMYYCRYRWYDPTVQRWISRDPLRSLNRYAYCSNRPTQFSDPLGLQDPITAPILIGPTTIGGGAGAAGPGVTTTLGVGLGAGAGGAAAGAGGVGAAEAGGVGGASGVVGGMSVGAAIGMGVAVAAGLGAYLWALTKAPPGPGNVATMPGIDIPMMQAHLGVFNSVSRTSNSGLEWYISALKDACDKGREKCLDWSAPSRQRCSSETVNSIRARVVNCNKEYDECISQANSGNTYKWNHE